MIKMKKYKISKNILFRQLASSFFVFWFRAAFVKGYTAYSFYYNYWFPRSIDYDTFSLLNIRIFTEKEKICVIKNTGLVSTSDILDSDIWLGYWDGKREEISDIVIEACKDSLYYDPLFPEKEDPMGTVKENEQKYFFPHAVFFVMNDGAKICVAIFYRLKLAQKVVAQMKMDFLGIETEYYENTTDFVDEFWASIQNTPTPQSEITKTVLAAYPFFAFFSALCSCVFSVLLFALVVSLIFFIIVFAEQ